MSLFQCENCGCCDNTAFGMFHSRRRPELFDWTIFPDRRGKKLCVACSPTNYSDSHSTGYGQWHNEFDRVFLPKGMFKTNREGNLEHIETGSTDFRKYELNKAKP